MHFLADESCDFAVVRALRAEGHDVLAVADASLGAEDPDVLGMARDQWRVLLTEDKDFGQLARAGEKKTGGVILLRYPRVARAAIAAALVRLAAEQGEELHRRFVVLEPGRVRMSADPVAAPGGETEEAKPAEETRKGDRPLPPAPPAPKKPRRRGKK